MALASCRLRRSRASSAAYKRSLFVVETRRVSITRYGIQQAWIQQSGRLMSQFRGHHASTNYMSSSVFDAFDTMTTNTPLERSQSHSPAYIQCQILQATAGYFWLVLSLWIVPRCGTPDFEMPCVQSLHARMWHGDFASLSVLICILGLYVQVQRFGDIVYLYCSCNLFGVEAIRNQLHSSLCCSSERA
ncbi:hypothetical protein BKA63DRAFT_527593 [Paraphoma chrysanthemicola]|nr:hypothetical protein BKA63DRAFT_527593 [Paraphoma chrysanthemicola]